MNKYIQRGAVLQNRIQLLNEFLSTSGNAFGVFLMNKQMTEKDFLNGLPKFLNIPGISNALPTSDSLREYLEVMKELYHNQHLSDLASKENFHADAWDTEVEDIYNADAEDDTDFDSADAEETEDEFLNAGGKKKKKLKEKLKKIKDKIKSGSKKIKDKLKKIKPLKLINKLNPLTAAIRNAALALVKMNVFNLAYNFSKMQSKGGKHFSKLLKIFEALGGESKNLKKAVEKGKGKRPIFAKKKSADGWEYAFGVDDGIALMGAATPFLIAAGVIIKQFKKDSGDTEITDEEITDDIPTGDADSGLDPETKDELKKISTGEGNELDEDDNDDETFFDKYKTPIFIGVGFALVAGTIITIVALNKKAA